MRGHQYSFTAGGGGTESLCGERRDCEMGEVSAGWMNMIWHRKHVVACDHHVCMYWRIHWDRRQTGLRFPAREDIRGGGCCRTSTRSSPGPGARSQWRQGSQNISRRADNDAANFTNTAPYLQLSRSWAQPTFRWWDFRFIVFFFL